MIKVVLFDADGMVIKKHPYFSLKLSEEYNIPSEKMKPFYKGGFLLCETGKADLKETFSERLKEWGVNKSVDAILEQWFNSESELDNRVVQSIKSLRSQGIKCYLST